MSTKTHDILKKAGLLKSFWGGTILDAEQAGGFDEDEQEGAQQWQTCACGRQSPNIPRHKETTENDHGEAWHSYGEPKDEKLKDLGVVFSGYVEHDHFESAALCLVKIEERAAKVIGAEFRKYVKRIDWHYPFEAGDPQE